MKTNQVKGFWSDASLAGGVIGIALFVLALVAALAGLTTSGTVSFIEFIILAALIYVFAKNRSKKHGSLGFSYGQSMGYVLAMMIFAGIIAGFGSFITVNYIAPPDYEAAMEKVTEMFPSFDIDDPIIQEGIERGMKFTSNPIFVMFSMILRLVIYGGLIGLVASAFVKRKPDMFASQEQTGTENE